MAGACGPFAAGADVACGRTTMGSAHVRVAPPAPRTLRTTRKSSMDQTIRLSGGRLGFLLIHGLGGTPLEMRYVAQGLAQAGHTVHVPQLAGHCGSSEELKATRWADWYATVEEEHNLLKERCDGVVVGGLSM